MTGKYALLFLLTAAPCAALAQDVSYTCTFGDLQRRVQIFTEPGVSVPCEVHYYKDTEAPGERQVLWSAASQEGYCESKTTEFVAKLEGWGWNCGEGAEAAPAPESEGDDDTDAPAYDDTDVLKPADPAEA